MNTSFMSATTVNTNRLGATKKADVDTVDTPANLSHSAGAGKPFRNRCQHRQHCQHRARFRRRRRRGGDGFNYRQFAAALNPSLLDKLPGTSAPGLFEQLDWRGNAQLANDRLAALVDERRWLPTEKRGGSDGSRP